MWNDTFRLSEAADIIGVPFRFLRGWLERGLIKTVGVDDSRPGHPHLITFTEVVRVAVTVHVYRLWTFGPDPKWNPGAFLIPFREIPDKMLQRLPKGSAIGPFKVGWRDNDTFRKQLDEEVARRPDDLLLVVSNFRDEPTGRPKIFTVISLGDFRKSVSGFLLADTAWTLVNVSNVVRQIIARRAEAERRWGRSPRA
jgi:hypothetical protein